jgi:hypothetical protein
MKKLTWTLSIMVCLLAAPASANDGTSVCRATQTALLPNGARAPVGVQRTNNNRHIELFDFHGNHSEEFEATFCGPWLDITNRVETTGRLEFVREVAKGVDNRLVAGRTEMPYVTIRFKINPGDARQRSGRIVLKRPGVPGMGSHQAEFSYELKRSIRLHPVSAADSIDLASGVVEQKVFLTGRGMDLILGQARNIPSNLPVEKVRIVSRSPESIELAIRFRHRTDLTLGMLFTNFLQVAPGTVLLPNPASHTLLVRVQDSNAPAHGQRSSPPSAAIIGVEGSATGNEGVGGGVRLPGRTPGTPRPPANHGAAPAGAPDLAVQIGNAFTGVFDIHETNRFGLCPDDATDPRRATVKLIPKLSLSVTNFGSAASPPSTLTFDRGANPNYDGNRTFPVPALRPGESRTFEIERKENKVCSTHRCRRCADGIHLGRFIPTIIDEKGKVETKPANPPDQIFHWNDRGVTASISVVAGDNNTANNSATVR